MGFESHTSPEWLEKLFDSYEKSPESVPRQWHDYFRTIDSPAEKTSQPPPEAEDLLRHSRVQSLIYRYRDVGHLLACTDPLSACPTSNPLLDLEAFGLSNDDLDRTFVLRNFHTEKATLREVLELLQQTYCRAIGAEFMHIQDPTERNWLKDRMEPCRNRPELSRGEKIALLEKLQQATLFEEFIHKSFLGQKRFSLEGGEALIPLLEEVLSGCARLGIRDLILGMAHRGRLNVLANIFGKPLENIFAEFEDNIEFGFVGDGDVKYHMGFSASRSFPNGHSLHMTLAANPSHLEAVNAVVEGKTRARQEDYGREGKQLVLPVLIHGDAAFAGQGMVSETLNLSQLRGYSTGGTLHLVLNNQIGFTTTPQDARSTSYATDVAKMLMVPIFHVHGEDPEAVVQAVRLALDYRQRYGRDVIVEVICYRRHGHNEGDEPFFTQPLMYQRIKDRPSPYEIYEDRLREEGIEPDLMERPRSAYEEKLENAKERKPEPLGQGFEGKWKDIRKGYETREVETGVSREILKKLAETLYRIPEEFTPHPKIEKLMQKRLDSVIEDKELDWPTAETLAFASLVREGHTVRLSGQDSRRGTFSQRHSTLFDLETADEYPLLQQLEGDGHFRAYDSMLSEAAVLGFEYGYSLERPGGLTVWEAQFGDFANGAQVIIDQFLVAGESKWDRVSGLTLFLPHGYEGQGAEHSSARIERFLQLCAEENLIVATPSTPGQFFHLLRRQLKQRFRKPLVIFTPKVLLRHPDCVSDLRALEEGCFREILLPAVEPDQAKTLALCSGKLFYEIERMRQKEERDDIAIARIEQLYPLREDLLNELARDYGGADRLVWIQEEPENMGAWRYLRAALRKAFEREPEFIGRKASAATAVGSHRLHKDEQERILARLFNPNDNQKTGDDA